ncbi:NB-ARC domain-containing protein [Streptomyces cinerochromogenes]|uniref:NB-ARC domain-containing protein n=1 Tax=Streptomyces cinerochromogenes TaxID=66422 RepID=A0ABW7BG39_9ACTN
MAFDGGRVAARGFQYQYLRTVEALLASVRTGQAAVCRIEGPGDTVSLQHADSVDFDLSDADGHSLMAVQVKSAGAGRTVRAREAVAVLVHLVTGIDAERYQLITSAVPDEGCLRLAELLRRNRGDVPRIKAELQNLLVKAPAAWGICQALPEEHWERLARSGIEFDGRSDGQLRADLSDALRAERVRAGQGLSRRAGGLVLGHLVAEVMRRAADPGLADWDVRDFHRSVLVGDEELIATVGRQEFGIVYGQLPPIPEVVRANLIDGIAEVLSPGEEDDEGVRTCVVTGLSGLGKSSLAAAHIADQAFRYDAVFWVDAESEEALVASFARVLAHLTGSEEPAEVRDPRLVRERVHAALQSLPGRWLMVFDDASAPLASAWIPRRGRGRVIVTTLGGHWHGVQGRIDLSPMSGEEALCLLRLRMDLSESEVEHYAASLSRLAQVLEYWPLAIEVACGYLVSCGIGVDRLPVYTDTLIHRAADDERSVPAGYPRTLAAAVALSTERLINGARSRGLLQPTLATVAALCWLAPAGLQCIWRWRVPSSAPKSCHRLPVGWCSTRHRSRRYAKSSEN